MRNYLLFICLFISSFVKGQTIRGKVLSTEGKPIEASIYIKQSDIITEFFESDESGLFNFKLKINYKTLVLEFRAMGYGVHQESLTNIKEDSIYTFKVVLEPETKELDEVIIAVERPVVLKGDTTEYYPKKFLNGTERKAEDFLKRIPGMEVAENGRLRYNGKIVESVQLNGDDLFGNKYAIATKNIGVDMIEKLQAIDNFSANPALKGIEASETVSLNLVLKKSKTIINLEGNWGLGMGDKGYKDLGLNMIAIKDKFKSFANISYNNIGSNYGFYDYFSKYTEEQDPISLIQAPVILPLNPIGGDVQNSFSRINNNLSMNLNALYRLSKKAVWKFSTYRVTDQLSQIQTNYVKYLKEDFIFDDSINTFIRPKMNIFETKLEWNLNRKSFLELKGQSELENINSEIYITQNSISNTSNNMSTNKKLYFGNLIYTYKINSKSAFQLNTILGDQTIPQSLYIYSPADTLVQTAKIGRKTNQINFKWLYRLKFGTMNMAFQNLLTKENLASKFSSNSINEIHYNTSQNSLIFQSSFEKFNFKLKPELKSLLINQAINTDEIASNKTLILPKISLVYEPNSLNRAIAAYSKDYKPNSIQNMYTNKIFEGNRSFSSNIIDLNLQTFENYNFSYRYHDSFAFFTGFLILNKSQSFNAYLNNISVDNNFSTIQYFKSPQAITNQSINVEFDKLISILQTSFKSAISFGTFEYKNVVNQSDLRNNKSTFSSYDLFIKTGFSKPYGFENQLTISPTKSFTEAILNSKNTTFSNTFKIVYKPSKNLSLLSTYTMMKPDIEAKKKYDFLDFELSFKPIKSTTIYEYRFIAKNIMNNRFFEKIENDDIAITTYKSNLIPQYFMFFVGFRL